MQKLIIIFITVNLLIWNNFVLSVSWKENFCSKVYQDYRPAWMLKQIHEDLKFFYEDGISRETLDLIMQRQANLRRYTIKQGKIYHKGKLLYSSIDSIGSILCQMSKLVKLPESDFIISLNDSFYHAPALVTCSGPIFSFAKREGDNGVILMPDRDVLRGYSANLKEVDQGKKIYPWSHKKDSAFWRGANSGFLPNDLRFMNVNNYLQYPRVILIDLSLKYPNFLDAAFNILPHTDHQTNALFKELGYVKNTISISEHLKYKYQILVDGYTCAFHRAYWQLFSDCVIFKQESPDFQWYYQELKPYVHYIPVKNDFSDLIEKIQWARSNDDEVQSIIKNANEFAQEHLLYEDVIYYLYLLITEYSKLLID